MHAPPLLGEILLLVAAAALGVAVFERLRLPAIVGFLVAGAIVGPGGLGLVGDPQRVRALAEFGVVFLLFEIGLELPLERLRSLGWTALVAGTLQVGGTGALAALGAWALGVAPRPALLVGGLVAMSSTALVMRLLAERGEVDAPHGQLALGILLFQDLCLVPLLLAVPILAGRGSVSAAALWLGAARFLGALALLFVGIRIVLPWLLERAARLRSWDLFGLIALLVVLGSAVAAEALGLTLAVGAFAAGLVTSASPYAQQLFVEVLPLRGVLLGLFFTAVGMLFDPAAALAHWPAVIAFASAAALGKALVIALVVAFVLRRGSRLGVLVGLDLAQTGEFSFVLAATAASAGLLSAPLQQVFVAGSVVTLVATPFLVAAAPHVAARVAAGAERLAQRGGPRAEPALADHAIVIGFGIAGRSVTRVLRALDVRYVIVEANAHTVETARARGEPIVYGDATRPPLLERLGVARARLVVVVTSDPTATRQIVALARAEAPDAAILARTRYVVGVDALAAAGARVVVAEEFESTIELVAASLRALGLPEPTIRRFSAELREEGYEPVRAVSAVGLDPWLVELLTEEQVSPEWVEVPDALGAEPTLAELEVRRRTGASVLAIERAGATHPNPAPGFPMRPGDRLLVFGSSEAIARLRALLAAGPTRPGPCSTLDAS